jgi:hypothetical protein
MRTFFAVFATCTLLSTGCRPHPEEAPDDLDALIHFFLQNVDLDEPDLVGAGAGNLVTWYDAGALVEDGLATGEVSDLTSAELAQLDDLSWEPDPSLPVGVYTLRSVDCTFEQMMYLYLEPDQMELFPDTYVDYERTFDSDPACFEDGTCDQLDYHSTNTTTLALGIEMTYEMFTRLRRFEYTDADGEPAEVVLIRNVMPDPAQENVSTGGYEQSYHIEAHVPIGAAETLHLYGLWNYGYLEGVDDGVAFWPNQYLDGLIELDERMQELCTEIL